MARRLPHRLRPACSSHCAIPRVWLRRARWRASAVEGDAASLRCFRSPQDGLKSLIELDTRGGFFAQNDVEKAVKTAVGEKLGNLQKLARSLVKTMEVATALVAYSVRVMLAHIRMMFDVYSKDVAKFGKEVASQISASRPQWLVDIFHVIAPGAEGSFTRAARQRIPNPFPHFREEESQDPQDAPALEDAQSISSDDDAVVDHHQEGGTVFKLLADGRRLPATKIIPGGSGFAIAIWDDASSFETLEPNGNINEDGTLAGYRPW
eukprot:1101348-Pyramimonas_sp.AAC.1